MTRRPPPQPNPLLCDDGFDRRRQVVLGGLVLPTVLIGIISVAFDESTLAVQAEKRRLEVSNDMPYQDLVS